MDAALTAVRVVVDGYPVEGWGLASVDVAFHKRVVTVAQYADLFPDLDGVTFAGVAEYTDPASLLIPEGAVVP